MGGEHGYPIADIYHFCILTNISLLHSSGLPSPSSQHQLLRIAQSPCPCLPRLIPIEPWQPHISTCSGKTSTKRQHHPPNIQRHHWRRLGHQQHSPTLPPLLAWHRGCKKSITAGRWRHVLDPSPFNHHLHSTNHLSNRHRRVGDMGSNDKTLSVGTRGPPFLSTVSNSS
jgi:hypothetical protein